MQVMADTIVLSASASLRCLLPHDPRCSSVPEHEVLKLPLEDVRRMLVASGVRIESGNISTGIGETLQPAVPLTSTRAPGPRSRVRFAPRPRAGRQRGEDAESTDSVVKAPRRRFSHGRTVHGFDLARPG
jgi:hypothetical protein